MENGEEDTFQTRRQCVPHETTSRGIWRGGNSKRLRIIQVPGGEEASGRELSWSRSGRQ